MEIHWKWKLQPYLGKKEQAMFLVVSVLNVHISFIGNTSKIAQVEKNLSSFVIHNLTVSHWLVSVEQKN